MKRGMITGLMTGMLIGGAAATMYGVMNWQTERHWNQQIRRSGRWLSRKTDEIAKML